MGVHGLWELLAPVGRRVSVETLAGKRLAIDASIWIIQFMKAMRDEKGEMVRNAHILGFFRRICKLLYLRTKPVFVFDGGTPALKRRTVIARRRQRENAQAKIRKTAEKLLLNQLKAMRLKELAADLEKQRQANDVKGKRPLIQEPSNEQVVEKVNDDVAVNYNQEELDEMLAASLAAEENDGFNVDASASGSGVPDDVVFGDGDDDDEDEEIILPEIHGKVDPAVLASLPPSMQLDLLVQMRERLMAENRQKYQRVKKAPARFSELQIEAYLKTVAFRREIDGVQKSAAGKAVGGMQTSRIASEANREFIFSSSFTGDKEAFTSVGQDKVGDDQRQPPPVNFSTNNVPKVSPVKRSVKEVGETLAESGKTFNDDVETYRDDRGRLRVSRVRALGIRMTRDLQRNLDLMKEIDQEKTEKSQEENAESNTDKNPIDVLDNSSDRFQNQVFDKNNDEVDTTNKPAVDGNSIEISFEDTLENEYSNDDDKLFACLVAGQPVIDFAVDDPASLKQSLDSADCEWEEGIIEDRSTANPYEGSMNDEEEPEWEEGFQDIQMKSSSCQGINDDGEAEWEEGSQDIQMNLSSCPDKSQRPATKGALEEEAEFQEAIRRSLEDTRDVGSINNFHEDYASERARGMVHEDADSVSINECKEGRDVEGVVTDVSEPSGSTEVFENICSEAKTAAFLELKNDASNIKLKNDTSDTGMKLLTEEAGEAGASDGEILVAPDTVPDEEELCVTRKQPFDSCTEDGNEHIVNKLVNTFTTEAAADDNSLSTAKLGRISADDPITDVDGMEKLTKEKICDFSMDKQGVMADQSFVDDNKEHEIMEDHLAEEMLFLGEEREELGSEQRRLERNAESVSSEMFAECQELLQMFGLPYIIAPMEAEAQCAFMELANLVDGVVTDDSDAFLFGARSVYKNIFDDRKYVETYLMKDMETELGLDREKLILMALLLGSDYTEGISGIGIVNAIEVVNAFPGKDGLREFREWIESPDPNILGKLDVESGGNSRKKGSKRSENITSGSGSNLEGVPSDQNVLQPVDDAERIKQIFMDKHRNVSKNWHVSSSFPSDAVISAYASPQVDKSTESLAWGKPDLFVLRKLCREKFGWGSSKADELLLPVLKEYNKHETQLRLEAFYTFNERFAKIRSKRIKKAVKGITQNKSSDLMDGATAKSSGSRKRRKANPSEEAPNPSGVDDAGTSSTQNNTEEKLAVKQLKRGRQAKQNTSEINSVKEANAARGRGRGRGRGQVSGRGRMKKNSRSADSSGSKEGDSCTESDQEMQVNRSEESPQIRKSGRPRKVVNYTDPDELDNRDKESEDCLKAGSTSKDPFLDQEVGPINESVGNERNDVEIGESASMDDIQMGDNPSKSEDYLQFGGGFCLEEDEDTELNKQDSSPTREMISEKDNDAIDSVEENGESKQSVTTTPSGPLDEKTGLFGAELNINDETHLLQDDAENDSEDHCPKSLRAMPNLRRKKRRT